jgi:hypothetical protein
MDGKTISRARRHKKRKGKRIMQVKIEFESDKFKYFLNEKEQKQIPYAVALTLAKIAFKAKDAIKNEMKIVFDRPTPYTLNAVYSLNNLKNGKFKMSGPQAEVGLKEDIFGKSYLKAQVEGGHRFAAKSEGSLFYTGNLAKGEYIVPAKTMTKDMYGNIPRGQMNKVLSGIKAFSEMGFNANASAARRSKAKGNAKRFAFIKPSGGNRVRAIYEREGKSLKPLFFVMREPKYKKRLKFYDIVENIKQKQLQREFQTALAQAMRTAQ